MTDAGTFDKYPESENYQDISITVAEVGQTVDALLLDGVEVAKNGGANWIVSDEKTVVLKKAYLAGFEAGTVLFTAVTSAGEAPFIVTITESEA